MKICHVCNTKELLETFILRKHIIAECQKCFTFNNISFNNINPQLTFDKEYYEKIQSKAFDKSRIGRRDPSWEIYERGLKLLKRLTEENIELEILDVGAGYGSFVATALENGHKASGVEISEHSAMIANQNGLSVQVGQIRNISFLREFNVITFWDVIEHMTEIDENIKYINDNLRNKSLILIATDNYDSLIVDIAKVLYYVFKWKWPMSRYLIPQNTVYFTPATLNALMKKYKFKLLHHEQIDYPISKINLSLLQKPLVTLLYWMGRKKKRQSQFLSIYQKE